MKCYYCSRNTCYEEYTCNICYNIYCEDCISRCEYCSENVCTNCETQDCTDQRCHSFFSICEDCMLLCNICNKKYCKVCIDEDDDICSGNCKAIICHNCFKKCEICRLNVLCIYDIIQCKYCNKDNCNQCYQNCKIRNMIRNTYLTPDLADIIYKFYDAGSIRFSFIPRHT